MATDAKTRLNQFLQKFLRRSVTKTDAVYTTNKFGVQYQCIVKLNCNNGDEYAGELSENQKAAENSAAEQVLTAFEPAIVQIKTQEMYSSSTAKKRKASTATYTPEEMEEKKQKAEEAGEVFNPAVTPKTKLNSLLMRVAKRILNKGDTVYESVKVASGFQATVKLAALPGEWGTSIWAGEVCSTKQRAEQSAAEIALQQLEAVPEIMEEANKPKGCSKGKGGKAKGKGWGWGKGMGDSWGTGDNWGMWGMWDTWGGMWPKGGFKGSMKGGGGPRKRITETGLTGTVCNWKETFGFITPDEPIDHPAADVRSGNLYFNRKSVVGGDMPFDGALVSFHVYEDGGGLGAEEVAVLT